MPTLDWIGKRAVVNHHREVPFHLLKCDPSLSVGDAGSGNLLVQGDNLLALKALLMDEIFGARNFVSNIVWHKRVSPANDAKLFSTDHDHILVYARQIDRWRPNRLQHSEAQKKYYSNPDNDLRGPWNSAAYTCAKTAEERPNLYYPITNPNTEAEVWPSRKRVWAYDQSSHAANVAENLVWWGKDGAATKPRIKKFLRGARPVVPRSIWTHQEAGHNQEAKLEVLQLLPEDVHFATPKPTRLLRRVLETASDRDSLILDSFAGSGTTGHAVLQMNAADGGTRHFILVEMEEGIAKDVTAQRLTRVIDGHKDVPGLGGGFRYCRLGQPIFDEAGNIRAGVSFADLAAHVYFAETGEPMPKRSNGKSALLGVHNGKAVYLLFNGVLGDRSPDGGNILTNPVLGMLPPHDGPRIIFGEGCRLGAARQKREGIVFKQIPYGIKVF